MRSVKTAGADDWREREFVTLGEAAAIADRSYSWARDRAIGRRLSAHRPPGGATVVTTESLARLLESEKLAPRLRRQSRPHYLRLVVDNSDKWLLRGRRPRPRRLALVSDDAVARPDRAA